METDPTEMLTSGGREPTVTELRNSAASADEDLGEPIPLDLPKGLVSENAFKWPADPMARGGMAEIFSGEDRRLGRTVILKAPRDGEELPAGMAELFQRRVTAEARILAKLQHPSIVKIYELGKATVGWPFCVLEKVEGSSLRDRLDELAEAEAGDGKPRTRERLELLSSLVSIAEALAYAHERHVVHRDCTPNNILLGKRGEATLIDWGIARDLDAPGGTDPVLGQIAPTAPGVTISAGTPPYLPLEQTQGQKADPSFDVYSFGITLYEVVSGRTPFAWRRIDPPEARTKQLAAFLHWLRAGGEAPPAMPRDPELSGIIARAMATAPADRFTADELVRALKQYLTGDLVFSHRYSRVGRLARWAGRHRAATVAAVSLVLFAVGGALVSAQLASRARHEADLQATAAAARADASDKRRVADVATREAEDAEAAANQAKRESKDADAMRRDAERKRRIAEDKRREFEQAASRAKDDADDAFRRYTEAARDKDDADHARDAALADRELARTAEAQAQRDRDLARAAQVAAEKDREAARAAREAADKERDAARATATAAEADRDAARAGTTAAEKERDLARTAQLAAERERDLAVAARAGLERERDEAHKKLEELMRGKRGARPAAPSAAPDAPSGPVTSPSAAAPDAPAPAPPSTAPAPAAPTSAPSSPAGGATTPPRA